MAIWQGDYPAAQRPIDEGITIAEQLCDELARAHLLLLVGLLALLHGDRARAHSMWDTSLGTFRTCDNTPPDSM